MEAILRDQEQALRNGQWVAIPNTNKQPGGAPHQRWLRILRGILALLATDRWEYERTFSALELGDSKQLTRDRPQIETYLGVELELLGLFRHTTVAYCWGPFAARFEEHIIDGRVGAPFVALSAQTVRKLTDVKVSATHILTVENQTAFETVLRPPLRQDAILYLFSSGHAGYAERELLAAWLRAATELSWHIWTDWDAGGVRIQADWARWANEHRLPKPQPWMWDKVSLARWHSLGQPLAESDRATLLSLRHPLAERLVESGYTLEQEAVLPLLEPQDFLWSQGDNSTQAI
jgi:hypothetical protein